MGNLTQPPVKDTHAPKFNVPTGAIDTHIHLFGPAETNPMVAGSIYHTADATPEMVLDMHRVIGVNRAVYISGGGYGRNPTHLMSVLRAHPDYFRGVIVPPEGLTQAQLEEMEAIGVRGVRYVSERRGGGKHLAPIMPELSARVHELGWHVQFYPHGEDILEHADQLMALPNTIVLDHFGSVPAALGTGQPAFRKILDMMETGRVWVKISGPMRCTEEEFPYAEVTPFARELVARFPERLVWGTDWPHVNFNNRMMPNDGGLMDLVADWIPDAATRKRILVDNAEKLYRF